MSSLTGMALTKRYGQRDVVRSVDLELKPTEVVGLLGPNGAGKTTTFNMVAGGVKPSSGEVFLGETEITGLPMYRGRASALRISRRNPRFSESFPSPITSTPSSKPWSPTERFGEKG